jgi:hypothetical protein
MYTSTLSLTSALDGVGGQRHAPTGSPRERTGTHCIGGPTAGLGRMWKISPDRPGRSESLYRLRYIIYNIVINLCNYTMHNGCLTSKQQQHTFLSALLRGEVGK